MFNLIILGVLGTILYGLTHKRLPRNGRWGISGDFGGGDSKVDDVQLPVWEEDKYYKQTQDVLFPFASDLLKGIVPDYYKAIGESGGTEFENMMSLVNRDTSKAVNENLARRGIGRGGLGASITAKSAADVNTKLRWSDFERAITGKEFLMNTGVNTLSGVRSGALDMTGKKNAFNQSLFEDQYSIAKYQDEQQAKEDAQWQALLKAGIGAAAMIATAGMAAPAAAGMGSASASGMAGSSVNFGGSSYIM